MAEAGWRVVVLTVHPDVARITTAALRRLGHEPVAVVGARSKTASRGLELINENTNVGGSAVAIAPSAAAVTSVVGAFRPDLLLTWSFPWRLSPELLSVPHYGAINRHPSLLPRHRGPNPLAWTIRVGDTHYGVTWHRMSPEYDSGPILAQESTPVLEEDVAYDVYLRLTRLGLHMLPGVLERVAAGDPGEPQPSEGVTLAPPFGEDYASIDWSNPAKVVHDQVRAWSFTPGTGSVPGPFADIDGVRYRVLRTTLLPLESNEGRAMRMDCADGPVWILERVRADA
jgi:methionyl-tRNA formyltransferase